jgi:nitric oxide reductase subunit B
VGSAVFTMFGAGLLGLAHTWPAVNKWTHGTLITPMHGHAAFYGAYAMIVLAVIAYALPTLTEGRPAEETSAAPGAVAPRAEIGHTLGYWAFWLQLAGMFGMTISFATAGIGQVYLERILGIGFLETQLKIQVHFLMLIGTAMIFTTGAALYIYDFFRTRPRFEVIDDGAAAAGDRPMRAGGTATA